MKRFKIALLIATIFAFAFTTKAQDSFTVRVKADNPKNYMMLLAYKDGEKYVMDTNYVVRNGYKVFTGRAPKPVMANLVVRNPNNVIRAGNGFIPGPGLSFVARNGATITIKGNVEKMHLATVSSNDKETNAYEVFRSKDKVWAESEFQLMKKKYANETNGDNSSGLNDDDEKGKSLATKRNQWAKEFVKKYPGTYAAIEVFATYALELSDEEQAKQFKALPPTYKNTELGKVIQEKIEGTEATAVGVPALPFSQIGYDGNVVDLNKMKGKVVLIDFWGSWCGPCRASFPHLKELYEKYKSQGFEIIGVAKENGSKESQLKAWKDAIEKDGINWLNILNDPAQTDILKKYGVVAFPTKILVDRNGVIQGRYMGENASDFDEKLQQLLESESADTPKPVQTGRAQPY